MSTTTSYRCDGPGCLRHVNGRQNYVPMGCGFITVTQHVHPFEQQHFCGWDCVLRYGAQFEPETVIRPDADGNLVFPDDEEDTP